MEEFYFTDLEELIDLEYNDEGKTVQEIAKKYELPEETVYEIVEKYERFKEHERSNNEMLKEREESGHIILDDLDDGSDGHEVMQYGDDYYKDGVLIEPGEQQFRKTDSRESLSKKDSVAHSAHREMFHDIVAKFEPNEQLIVSMKAGYFDGVPKKDEEIAKAMGMKKEELAKKFKEMHDKLKARTEE